MAFLEPRLFELVKVEPNCNQASKEGVLAMIRYYNELLAKEAGYVKEVEDDIPSVNWNFNVLKEYYIIIPMRFGNLKELQWKPRV